MAARKDTLSDVGKLVMQEAGKAVAKEMASGGTTGPLGELIPLSGAAKTVSDIIDAAVQSQVPVTIQLYRTDPMSGVDQYLGNIGGVDPNMIKHEGLEATLQRWSGGGVYKGTIRCAQLGIPDKRFSNIHIAGAPLDPLPMRKPEVPNNAGGGGALQQIGTPFGAPLQQGPNQYYAGPGFASYLGFAPLGQQAPQNPMNELLQVVLHQNKEMTDRMINQQGRGGDSEALRALEKRAEDAERRAEREQQERRHSKEMATLRKLIEESRAPRENTAAEIAKAITPIAAAVLPVLITQRSEASTAMSTLYNSMIAANKNTTDQALGFMQASMAKTPVEERMTNMMGNMLGITTSMMQAMQQMQPEGPPFWQQMLGQVLETVGQVGQAAFSGGGGEEPQHQLPAMPIQVAPALVQGRTVPPAAVAAEAPEADDTEDDDDDEPSIITSKVPPRTSFDDGFRRIFDLIEKDGDPHDIAFRIWKHATSKNALALIWFNKAEEATFELLSAFVEREEMDIDDDRATAIADALLELHQHFSAGGTPEAYLQHYRLSNTPPKSIQINPLTVFLDGKDPVAFGEPIVDPSAPVEMALVPPVEPKPAEAPAALQVVPEIPSETSAE